MSRIAITRRTKTIGALAIAGITATSLFLMTPGTSARPTVSKDGTVNVATGVMGLGLGDNHNSSGTFNLDFPNLYPGGPATSDVIKIENTGTIDAKQVKLGAPLQAMVVKLPGNPDPSKLMVAVDGVMSYTPATQLPQQIDLGSLNAKKKRNFVVWVKIASAGDDAAGNAADSKWTVPGPDGKGSQVKVKTTVTLNG